MASIPGSIAGAFRSDRPDIRYVDIYPDIAARINTLLGAYDSSRDPAATNAYLSAYAAGTPQAQGIAQGNLGFLNNLVTQPYDAAGLYKDLLGANQGALGTFLMNPALNELTRQRKAVQALQGYGGQGAGIYDTLLQDRTLQQLAQQAVPQLLGYTNQAYSTAGNLANQNILNRLGVIGTGLQYNQLDVPALRYLEPTRLARGNLNADLGNLNALTQARQNNSVFYRQPGLAERIGRGFDEVQHGIVSEANDALSLYERAYGSGLLGGLGVQGGGPPGTAGAGTFSTTGSRARNAPATTDVPYNWNNAPSSYGSSGGGLGAGAGGGGGWMDLFKSALGGGGRSGFGSNSYPGYGNTWQNYNAPTVTSSSYGSNPIDSILQMLNQRYSTRPQGYG